MTNPLLADLRGFLREQVEAAGGLYDCALIKSVPDSSSFDPENPLEPIAVDESVSHPFQGSLDTSLSKINGTLIQEGEALLTVIAGFLPDGVNPEVNDEAMVSGRYYVILEIEGGLDEASFLCRVKAK